MSAALKLAAANTSDIVDAIQSNGSYTKLLAALKAAGLLETFRGLDRLRFSRHPMKRSRSFLPVRSPACLSQKTRTTLSTF